MPIKRNYRKEYDSYHALPKQKLKRASRNAANRIVKPGLGKEVHHRNGNALDNRRKNLVAISKSKNRRMQPPTKTHRIKRAL
jgi:hypothetical protein